MGAVYESRSGGVRRVTGESKAGGGEKRGDTTAKDAVSPIRTKTRSTLGVMMRCPATDPRLIASLLLSLALSIAGCMMSRADGFNHELPSHGMRVVVWGSHPQAAAVAGLWLQKHGLRVVERSRLSQILSEQKIVLTSTRDEEADLLNVGKLAGADQVIFIDTIGERSVSVRSVKLESAEVIWSGSSSFKREIFGKSYMAALTCEALRAAWGLPVSSFSDPCETD